MKNGRTSAASLMGADAATMVGAAQSVRDMFRRWKCYTGLTVSGPLAGLVSSGIESLSKPTLGYFFIQKIGNTWQTCCAIQT